MKRSLGFGLENIGLLALRYPRFASVVFVLSVVLGLASLKLLNFNGNLEDVLKDNSPDYLSYYQHSQTFHNYSQDLVLVIEHPDFLDVDVFEDLRTLQLDLALEDGVDDIYSIFTISDLFSAIDSDTDNDETLLADSFNSSEQLATALDDLLAQQPAARAILAPKAGAMLMMLSLSDEVLNSDSALSDYLPSIKQSAQDYAPPGTRIRLAGMPKIRVSIVDAIISDQTLLTGSGIILGCLVAWLIFGTVRSAIICTMPAFIAVLWVLSAFALTGKELSFFTTALPSLALIIAFADTIVLYFCWQGLNDHATDEQQIDNLRAAVSKIGPASSLTSITTAIAFGSFALVDNQIMNQFALYGVLSVIFAFLGVIVGMPLSAYWAVKLFNKQPPKRAPRLLGAGPKIAQFVTVAPRLTVTIACAFLLVCVWGHTQLKASYTLSEYFPYGSEVRESEAFLDKVFGGAAQYYVVLPVTSDGEFADAANRQRLTAVEQAVSSVFGAQRTLSLASAWRRLNEQQISELADTINAEQPALVERFVSPDRRWLQIAASTSAGASTHSEQQPLTQLQTALAQLNFADQLSVTGLRVLMAKTFPVLIEQLRSGLLVSIFLAVAVVAVATRSLTLALASLLPNLIPILFAETAIYVSGASLSVTNVIALTIAFGIAIDNAVHVINAYQSLSERGLAEAQRVLQAVAQISPALVASTCIVCVAAVITQFSSLPMVTGLGLLLIATLIIALAANLLVLPSAILFLRAKLQTTNE